jgi:hypothetical protein
MSTRPSIQLLVSVGPGLDHSLGSAVRQGLVDDEDGEEEHDGFVR